MCFFSRYSDQRMGSMESILLSYLLDLGSASKRVIIVFKSAGIACNKVLCHSSEVRILLSEANVFILGSGNLVGGSVLSKEGGLISFLILGGTSYI